MSSRVVFSLFALFALAAAQQQENELLDALADTAASSGRPCTIRPCKPVCKKADKSTLISSIKTTTFVTVRNGKYQLCSTDQTCLAERQKCFASIKAQQEKENAKVTAMVNKYRQWKADNGYGGKDVPKAPVTAAPIEALKWVDFNRVPPWTRTPVRPRPGAIAAAKPDAVAMQPEPEPGIKAAEEAAALACNLSPCLPICQKAEKTTGKDGKKLFIPHQEVYCAPKKQCLVSNINCLKSIKKHQKHLNAKLEAALKDYRAKLSEYYEEEL